MEKVKSNQIEMLTRVIPEKGDDAEWKRSIYITGGYKALYAVLEALQKLLTTDSNKTEIDIEGLQDYQQINTAIKIRLQDWE